MARKTIRPFMLSTTGQPLPIQKTIYDFLGIIATMFIINTMSMSFVGLYLDPVFQIWRQIYFVQFSLGAAAWAGLKLAKKPLMRAQKQRGGPPIRQTVEPKAAEMDVTDLGGIEPPLPESTSSKAGLVDEKK
jgi:lysophospholipid acyltransferase